MALEFLASAFHHSTNLLAQEAIQSLQVGVERLPFTGQANVFVRIGDTYRAQCLDQTPVLAVSVIHRSLPRAPCQRVVLLRATSDSPGAGSQAPRERPPASARNDIVRTFPGSFRTFPGNVQGRLVEIVGPSALALHAETAALDEASQLAGSGIAAYVEYPAVVGVGETWVPKEVLAQPSQTSVHEFGNSGAEAGRAATGRTSVPPEESRGVRRDWRLHPDPWQAAR